MKTSSAHPGSRSLEIAAIAFSVIAILISAYALVDGRRQHQDERSTEILDAVYEGWTSTAAMTDWEVQHVLEAPQTYHRVRDLSRMLTEELSPQEKAKVFLKERSAVNLVFSTFEHHLKQWMLARNAEDDVRLAILDEEIEFYAEIFLRNPRLLWYWSDDGGGWVHGADPSTVVFYDERILNDPQHPLIQEPDAEGILPGFTWKH